MIATLLLACTVIFGNVIEWETPPGACGGIGTAVPVDHYEIERQTVSTGLWTPVGIAPAHALWWDTSADNPLPHADVAYRYRVYAYGIVDGQVATCGPSMAVDACGPPLCCFNADGSEYQCYVGAPASRCGR